MLITTNSPERLLSSNFHNLLILDHSNWVLLLFAALADHFFFFTIFHLFGDFLRTVARETPTSVVVLPRDSSELSPHFLGLRIGRGNDHMRTVIERERYWARLLDNPGVGAAP